MKDHSMDISAKLRTLLELPAENEVVEFKEAKNSYDFSKLGKYFSALSNEANLKRQPSAWLVFGVNKHHQVVGSYFRSQRKDLDSLKEEIANKTTNRITFIEIHEVQLDRGRVVLFEIPAAPKGLPIAFEGHYFGRDGEALSPLNLEEIERIRTQSAVDDWSAAIVPGAGEDDLARKNFKNKFPDKAAEVDGWDNTTFLNKAKLTIKVLDLDYARLLASNGNLTLQEIIALDKVQKRHPLNDDDEKLLKVKLLIEGRKPNFYIAKPVAQKTGQKASYSKNRAFDKQYYLDLICKAIGEHGSLTRKEIDELLWNKLPDWMDDKQRKNKVGNLIGELRRQQRIVNRGCDARPVWVLVKNGMV